MLSVESLYSNNTDAKSFFFCWSVVEKPMFSISIPNSVLLFFLKQFENNINCGIVPPDKWINNFC